MGDTRWADTGFHPPYIYNLLGSDEKVHGIIELVAEQGMKFPLYQMHDKKFKKPFKTT